MRDYRVPKNIGGFNPQKLYTEILKSESTERWCREDYGVMTLISFPENTLWQMTLLQGLILGL